MRAGGAHLDDALACLGDVGVFFAQLAVREYLDVVLAVGGFHDVLGKQLHADGFGLAIRFHTSDLDYDLVSGKARQHRRSENGCQGQKHDSSFHYNLHVFIGKNE